MATVAQQHDRLANAYPSHSIMEDGSDSESDPDLDAELDADQQRFYQHQQQQATYYQQHQQRYGSNTDVSTAANGHHHQPQQQHQDSGDDDEMYSDEGSSIASIPDENIDFSLTYALHTFLATVEGQASVVKGDSLLLLDDANSYWWLVRVLKTEDVGYIPAENIETPYERLARLNKHRNVELASATIQEKQAGTVQGRERLKGMIGGKAKNVRSEKSGDGDQGASRRVFFAPPTYVDHPGVTWSSGEEDSEGEYDEEQDGDEGEGQEGANGRDLRNDDEMMVDDALGGETGQHMLNMEPDDGVEWADGAGLEEQRRVVDQRLQNKPKSTNLAQQDQQQQQQPGDPYLPTETKAAGPVTQQSGANAPNGGNVDPYAINETRRITVTPAVAQSNANGGGPLLPSAMHALNSAGPATRTFSGQSTTSVTSVVSTGSSIRSSEPVSPPQEDPKKTKKGGKKGSKDDSDGGDKRRSRGMLGGLFSRNKDKSKKGISSNDPRSSEDSIVSGAVDTSPASQGRYSEDSGSGHIGHRAPTPAEVRSLGGQSGQPVVSQHGMRLQQRDQATQQAYTSKYLNRSPGDNTPQAQNNLNVANGVGPAANAMRLAASMNAGGTARPSSIILSPNPAGPPLLNVIRVFSGEHIKSEASFKTVLLNETTSSTDLIRQLIQRFHLHHASAPGADAGYYLTIKDVSGEEMELTPGEKPLAAFQEAVQRWASEDDEPGKLFDEMTPKVKRSSIASISSIASLSSHPAIAKLGMNDFSDDSTVKIYVNRRRPGSQQVGQHGMPESNSEFSSHSTQLSAVQESSPEMQGSEWSSAGLASSAASDPTASPTTPQTRYNPFLTVATTGQASPERFSSPSARFTVQIFIHPGDLPDGSVFDPTSEAIVSRQAARERQPNGNFPMDLRRRLFQLPRNATVVDAVEQGLERFGIQEGVVDGGDDVEDRVANRIFTRVRYALAAVLGNEERVLGASSKLLETYSTPPQLRPMERTTMEQRRRSRDHVQNAGQPSDILPTDPVFVLRRVSQRSAGPTNHPPPQVAQVAAVAAGEENGTLSQQDIIAAQRAASRASQKALISSQNNTNQGVDVVLPHRGTLRSSRLMAGDGEVVRYSYIDDDGESYDISELVEEEWGKDGSKISPNLVTAPTLQRMPTDSSTYVTAPSTPEPTMSKQMSHGELKSDDILRGVLQRAAGQPDGKLEEKLQRVINKAKSGGAKTLSSPERGEKQSGRPAPSGRTTPQPNGTSRGPDITSRPGEKGPARQVNYHQTAASVNNIVSRHRQQPSIASILSDISGSPAQESLRDPTRNDRDSPEDDRGVRTGASTPMTATTSTHPTPPVSSVVVFTRSISSASPTPRGPVSYSDDFGMKNLMAMIDVRSRGGKPKKRSEGESTTDEIEKRYYGDKIDFEDVHPEIKVCFTGLADRLSKFDREVDELLASVLVSR